MNTNEEPKYRPKHLTIKDIILDLSGVNYVDSMGCETILRLNQLFKKLRVQLHLSQIKSLHLYFIS